MTVASLTIQPVAIIHTPYREKFSVPRQPDLVRDGTGTVELLPPYNSPETVRGLEQFSHLWLLFQFDRIAPGKWRPTVRPPRLGGNRRVGVFASRSPYRPNPLGLSKVELRRIEYTDGKLLLHLGSVDLVDGTPIFDIKPYVAYADSELAAASGFAPNKPSAPLRVEFSAEAQHKIKKLEQKRPHFGRFIRDLIRQDPRPAYRQGETSNRVYGISLYEFNVRWKIKESAVDIAEVFAVETIG